MIVGRERLLVGRQYQMNFILCSAAFVLCMALQISSQSPPKPIGEWSPNRAERYPNPWVDSQGCKTKETSGLCDYNEMLNETERTYFSLEPELKKGIDAYNCLCKPNCDGQIRIIITMALMKKIGPHITDYRAAAKEFAEIFRTLWSLNNCTVILVASKNDGTSFLDAGARVIELLSVNVTEKIDQDIYEKYFNAGRFVEGLNATVNEYRSALNPAVQGLTSTQTTVPPRAETGDEKEETWAAWKIFFVAGAIGLGLLLIGIFLRSRLKPSSSDVNRQVKNRRLPDLPSIYEELGYDSIGLPLQELAGNKEGPTTIIYNMYEHIGYDSINQVQEEIALREEKMHFSSEVYGYNKYDYIDESQRQAIIGRGRPKPPLPDEGITCADRGHPIHSEDLSHSGYVDRHEVCRSDSFTNKDEHFSMLNGQSEAFNTFSNINREELNPKLHLENSESNLKEMSAYLDLVTTKVNPNLDLVSTKVNPYMDLVLTEAKPYLDLVSAEVNPYLDLVSAEANPYLDLVSSEVNPYLDLISKKVSQYSNLDSAKDEVNQYLELEPDPT